MEVFGIFVICGHNKTKKRFDKTEQLMIRSVLFCCVALALFASAVYATDFDLNKKDIFVRCENVICHSMEALPGRSYGGSKGNLYELQCSLAHTKYLNGHQKEIFKGDSSLCLRINEDGSAELNPKDAANWSHKLDFEKVSITDANKLWGSSTDLGDGTKRYKLQEVGGKNTYHLDVRFRSGKIWSYQISGGRVTNAKWQTIGV